MIMYLNRQVQLLFIIELLYSQISHLTRQTKSTSKNTNKYHGQVCQKCQVKKMTLLINQYYNLLVISMANRSQIFDVLITPQDLQRLNEENKQLKEAVQDLKIENEQYNKIIDSLRDNIRQHVPLVNAGLELQSKVVYLSKSNLQLSRIIIDLRTKMESLGISINSRSQSNEEKAVSPLSEQEQFRLKQMKLKEEASDLTKVKQYLDERLCESRKLQGEYEEELVTLRKYVAELELKLFQKEENDETQLQLQLRKSQKEVLDAYSEKQLLQLKTKHSESSVKAYQIRLQQKDKVIRDLQSSIQALRSQLASKVISKEQKKIIKDWKLTTEHIDKVEQINGSHSSVVIAHLKKRIDELEQRQKDYDYLFANERNLIEEYRKKLQAQETKLLQKQNKLRQSQMQLNKKSLKLQESLTYRRMIMQSSYQEKIKSLRQFTGECSECQKHRDYYQKVVNKLRHQVEKADRQLTQKQNQLDYIREVIKSMSFQKAIQSQIQSQTSSIDKTNKSQLKERLSKKRVELLDLVNVEVSKVEVLYKLEQQ